LLDRIACEATQVIEEQYRKSPRSPPLAWLDTAAGCYHCPDRGARKRCDNRPAFCLGRFPAVARLILDAGSALHVRSSSERKWPLYSNTFCLGVLRVRTFSLPMPIPTVLHITQLALQCRFDGAWSDEFSAGGRILTAIRERQRKFLVSEQGLLDGSPVSRNCFMSLVTAACTKQRATHPTGLAVGRGVSSSSSEAISGLSQSGAVHGRAGRERLLKFIQVLKSRPSCIRMTRKTQRQQSLGGPMRASMPAASVTA